MLPARWIPRHVVIPVPWRPCRSPPDIHLARARFPLVSVAWVLRWERSSLPWPSWSTRVTRDWSFATRRCPSQARGDRQTNLSLLLLLLLSACLLLSRGVLCSAWDSLPPSRFSSSPSVSSRSGANLLVLCCISRFVAPRPARGAVLRLSPPASSRVGGGGRTGSPSAGDARLDQEGVLLSVGGVLPECEGCPRGPCRVDEFPLSMARYPFLRLFDEESLVGERQRIWKLACASSRGTRARSSAAGSRPLVMSRTWRR